jgi:hypothetical protein
MSNPLLKSKHIRAVNQITSKQTKNSLKLRFDVGAPSEERTSGRPMQLDYESWYRPAQDFDQLCVQLIFLHYWPEGVPIGKNHRLTLRPASRLTQ